MPESVKCNTGNVPRQRHATDGQNGYVDAVPNETNERGSAFAALIRDKRLHLGLTQEDVFSTGVISKSTLVRWETGRAERPDPDQVRDLCVFLRIDPAEAAIALGYLRREDVTPRDQERGRDPAIMRAIEALEDPNIPSSEKEQWLAYLEYLRAKARRDGAGSQATG